MKVKIIESDNKYTLEWEVNEILSEYSSSKIFDIKYSSYVVYNKDYYSAMIIFK